jgi:hypothetical protein
MNGCMLPTKKPPEFVGLSRRYDLQAKFRNEFLNRNIFGMARTAGNEQQPCQC